MNWLTKISFPAMNASIPELSPQEIYDTCTGPYYHGAPSAEIVSTIIEKGFAWEEGEARTQSTSHGYENREYGQTGCKTPVHHLGYGVYLTETKNIAKQFGYGSAKNLVEVYITKDARMPMINFGSPNTMMKWWKSMGYDCELAKVDRVAATKKLTESLASQYDAVLYKGKGIYRLLDGNQVCVYNTNILRRVNKKLSQPGERGAKVRRKVDNITGKILDRRPIDKDISELYNNREPEFLDIQWSKGGRDRNVYPSQVDFL